MRLNGGPVVSTFSIVAHDPAQDTWGIGVQSRFLAVGAVVPWAQAGSGAIATQSWANTSFGPVGLALLTDGISAAEALAVLLRDDPGRETRQVGIVDRAGQAATFTGSACFDWAGGRIGRGYAAQGNILAGPDVVDAMAASFEGSDGPLAQRLIGALAAGQEKGGDKRGMQSAALLVVKAGGGYGGWNDRYIDLRVEDHPAPIEELARVLRLHRLYFERTRPEDRLPLAGDTLTEIRALLQRAGYATGSETYYDSLTCRSLESYFLTENFDDRWTDAPVIDRMVLAYMREHCPDP